MRRAGLYVGLVLALSACADSDSPKSDATPTAPASGVPATFLGAFQRGSGDTQIRDRALVRLSSADGSVVQTLVSARPGEWPAFADPMTAADGSVWAMRVGSGQCASDVVTVDENNVVITVVSAGGRTLIAPAVSPDSTQLAYLRAPCDTTTDGFELVVRDIAAKTERVVRAPAKQGAAALRPAGGPGKFFSHSPSFAGTAAWLDDTSLVLTHTYDRATDEPVALAVVDVTAGKVARRESPPAGCTYWSAAALVDGVVAGMECSGDEINPPWRLTLLAPDLRTQRKVIDLPRCVKNPELSVAAGVVLVAEYVYCGGSSDAPTQRIELLEGTTLRRVHDYTVPTEWVDNAAW